MSVRRKPGASHAVFPIHLEEVEEQDRCDGPIAQWLEQRTHNPLVPGSSPGGPTIQINNLRLFRRFSILPCDVNCDVPEWALACW